jgi:pimeloyl-ACP methyl ester carboxylesterase
MDPETRYAIASGFHIAYQVLGEGPPHVLIVPGLFSHLEMQWRLPTYRRFMRALARRCCLIRYDKRGTGLSDPVAAVPDMEERIAEVAAVMDTLGLGSTALFGFSEGGPIALNFAATHPHRVSALVLYGTYARKPPEAVLRQLSEIGQRWGTGETFDLFAPRGPLAIAQAIGRRHRARQRESGHVSGAGCEPCPDERSPIAATHHCTNAGAAP